MTSFKWKRKAGENVSKETVKKFCFNSVEEDSSLSESFDLLQRVKLPKIIALEDRTAKKNRLYEEGCVLSTNQRYWEALKKWDEATQLCPDDGKLYEMKSQVLMELQEVHPAIHAAEQAVKLSPAWWVAYQTLGRALLSAGEVQMAIRNFCKACHLNPGENELWEEDLQWALSLQQKSKEISIDERSQANERSSVSIRELADHEEIRSDQSADSDHEEESTKTLCSTANTTLSEQMWIKMRKTE